MNTRNSLILQFVILLTIWLAAFWGALTSAVNVWISSETYKHCFFILPLSLYLIYERRGELRLINFQPNYWLLIPLLASLFLNLLGELLGLNLITHGAAYLALISVIWLCFGSEFVRKFWFPILFLGFAVPFGDELVPTLQDVTAYLTVELVRLIGIPIYRDGLYLYVPNGTFLVAEACAGIRFLIAAFALGTLFAYLNYKTKWKFFGFIAISIVVPIIANGIRAFGIVAIGYTTDMEHAVGADHLVYGWFFFAFVLLLLFGLGQLGREKTLFDVNPSEPDGSVSKMSNLKLMLVVLLSMAIPVYSAVLNSYDKLEQTNYLADRLFSLPNAIKVENDWAPMIVGAHESWSGTYQDIPLYVAYFQADNDEHELVSGLHRYFNIDLYTRKAFGVKETKFGRVNYVDLVDVSGRGVRVFYWFSVDGQRSARSIETKLRQASSKLEGRRGEGFLIAIASDELSEEYSRLVYDAIEKR
jgi:exosortase A